MPTFLHLEPRDNEDIGNQFQQRDNEHIDKNRNSKFKLCLDHSQKNLQLLQDTGFVYIVTVMEIEKLRKLHQFYTEESKNPHCFLEAECILRAVIFFFPKKEKTNFVLSNVNSVVKETL